MRKRRKRKRWGRKRGNPLRRFLFKVAVIVVVLVALFFVADRALQPMIVQTGTSEAQNFATVLIDGTVANVLTTEGITYDKLAEIDRDANQNITAVETNTVAVDQLKAALGTAISTAILADGTETVKVPLGTLTGSGFLGGVGPKIPIRLQILENVVTTISDVFDSAGINQTRHQIMLNVATKISIIVPWGVADTITVTTNYCVAETVIVGTVPGAYTNISDADDALENDVGVYGAKGD